MNPPIPEGYQFYTRKFLNQPGFHGAACVLASLRNGSAYLEISDCSRKVELTIEALGEFTNEKEFENTLFKLTILENVIKGLHKALQKDAKARGYKKTTPVS